MKAENQLKVCTILAVIPARYASTRFPGKALADINGRSMIRRVYEQVLKASSITDVIVATDHEKILNHVRDFGGNVCLTKETHASGTDRCYEALTLQQKTYDYIINVQGDEPFVQPQQIDLLAGTLNENVEIATLAKAVDQTDELHNPNVVKVVFNHAGEALYFSRSTIPHVRNDVAAAWLDKHQFYKHIGLYAFRKDILKKLTTLPLSSLEKAESLEQLRWLENGYKIRVALTEIETHGIDTPEDLKKALEHLRSTPGAID